MVIEESLPAYHNSIFFQLFNHASDVDSKLILLDQVLELGEEQDIPLLEELESTSELKVSNRAYEVKLELLARMNPDNVSDEDKLPMNLCFLYEEFEIRPAKVDNDPDIDFDLSLEILSDD
ncbi:hypothetical protein [Flagellimonas allohymeniacidonis]|uniref:Uncharacterized protein n=1 Tax=Flagellimonas allohymeniacidonis TaxID=2517819 RepID=A0A4Q8QEB1_9FLAO|nr:hypothetical protein [Allomuricauda hymeniacidonis]TAI48771.1 hypothetical protein EW142_02935 [Allomuricauda hymeniacidonis]